MKGIEIISTPPGFAPEGIRVDWVGVQIPLATEREIAENPPSGMGIGSANQGGFMVLASKATEALKKAGHRRASLFWEEKIPGSSYLVFRREVCKEVEIQS